MYKTWDKINEMKFIFEIEVCKRTVMSQCVNTCVKAKTRHINPRLFSPPQKKKKKKANKVLTQLEPDLELKTNKQTGINLPAGDSSSF